MTEEEMKLLPYGFIKKYGSYIHLMKRIEQESHTDENRNIQDFYEQVKDLKQLLVDAEKELNAQKHEHAKKKDIVSMENLLREAGDYFKRQPRVDLKTQNYNFEQFRRFTEMFEGAAEKDRVKSEKFYKLVKYVKANINNEKDPLVHKFINI